MSSIFCSFRKSVENSNITDLSEGNFNLSEEPQIQMKHLEQNDTKIKDEENPERRERKSVKNDNITDLPENNLNLSEEPQIQMKHLEGTEAKSFQLRKPTKPVSKGQCCGILIGLMIWLITLLPIILSWTAIFMITPQTPLVWGVVNQNQAVAIKVIT